MLEQFIHDHARDFHPVVPFEPLHDKLFKVDLSANNNELTPEIMNDINRFCNYFTELLEKNQALYAIGGYAEHRTVYANSAVFDGNKNSSPRRFHIGVDIWGKALTPVFAPLDGTVHSFANNKAKGDYGATIILSHKAGQQDFYTLYGHLSLDSIAGLKEGKFIRKGQQFASFGIPAENGNWPPHLHFQVIKNIGDWKGDYPGVCAFDEKDQWLDNSPDPDLILQMNKYAF